VTTSWNAPRPGGRGYGLVLALAFAAVGTFAPGAARAGDANSAPPMADDASPAIAAAPTTGARPAFLRVWFGAGPYRPPADPAHWIDPRGSVVSSFGVAVPVCPVAFLGVEGAAWFASYEPPPGPSLGIRSGARLHGEYVGLGPLCAVSRPIGPYEPWASLAPLVVRAHLEWPATFATLPGTAEIEDRWAIAPAFAAGLAVRLWGGMGAQLRWQYVPLSPNFGILSRGSGNAGVDAALLSLYCDLPVGAERRRGR
jgi:hypothetical protein